MTQSCISNSAASKPGRHLRKRHTIRNCSVGRFQATMALFVPAIAWIEEAALIVLLGVVALLGAGAMFWWIGSNRQVTTTSSAAGH